MTRFTLVSAVYDVADYLPDFIEAIEAQTFPLERVEVILVDDGSTDDSGALAEQWRQRRPELVTVLHQANAGQAAARNAGIAAAHGEWISFPDPDDVVEADYLTRVDDFLTGNPDTDMVATHRLIWHEGGEPANSHRLRVLFREDRLVDLDVERDYFHGSAPATFFRRDAVTAQGCRFDPRIRPNFEDGHFTTRYLLGRPRRRVGFLGSARYHYRMRTAANSTLSGSRGKAGRYGDVLEFGFLDVVDRAIESFGEVPGWLKSYLVYELGGYFAIPDAEVDLRLPFDDPALAKRFHELVARILVGAQLGDVLDSTRVPPNERARHVLAHGYAEDDWHEPAALVAGYDRAQRLAEVRYYFTGTRPAERFRSNTETLTPVHAKDRSYRYGGRALLHERIAWLPANHNLSLELDGAWVPLVFERPEPRRRTLPKGAIAWNLDRKPRRDATRPNPYVRPVPTSREGRRARAMADRPKYADRYRHAWVCTDASAQAGDNGEVFFKYLRREHPEVNAWFVQRPGTPGWRRLRAEGYGDRVIAHGSTRWRVLMAHARHLIASRADPEVAGPPQVEELANPDWRFHLVTRELSEMIEGGKSRLLDDLPIQTLAVGTPAELAAIAGNATPYRYTTREARLTGLPVDDEQAGARIFAAIRASARSRVDEPPQPTPVQPEENP